MIEAQRIKLEAGTNQQGYYPEPSLMKGIWSALIKHEAEVYAKIADRNQTFADLPKACLHCLGSITSIAGAHGLSELFGCKVTSGAHCDQEMKRGRQFHQYSQKSSVLIFYR
jgi:hypothetical protein